MNQQALIKEVKNKFGDLSGEELIEKVEEATGHIWGSRFLRHNKYFYNSSRDPLKNPKLSDLHQYALKILKEGSRWVK